MTSWCNVQLYDHVRFLFTAKYSKPTIISEPEKISQSTGGTLVCNSVGGYPKGQIRWFGELNEDWTGSSDMEVKETKSGLFELSSKLTLLRGSTYSKYTCAVFNTSGGKEDEATFEVPDGQDTSGHSGIQVFFNAFWLNPASHTELSCRNVHHSYI